ncbi:MAG: hypothetical protein Q7T57_04625 [Dehalococcoidales bacterium]|nr:hypothetical protein [Dehalococcoidales bacterium]
MATKQAKPHCSYSTWSLGCRHPEHPMNRVDQPGPRIFLSGFVLWLERQFSRQRRIKEVKMAFHWKDGWYFERLENGAVRIFHIPPGEKIADTDIEIDANSWASIVASVTHSGENAATFGLAQNLHQV